MTGHHATRAVAKRMMSTSDFCHESPPPLTFGDAVGLAAGHAALVFDPVKGVAAGDDIGVLDAELAIPPASSNDMARLHSLNAFRRPADGRERKVGVGSAGVCGVVGGCDSAIVGILRATV